MRDKDYTVSADFLKRFFGETLHKVELRACSNDRSGGAVSLFAREPGDIEQFCRRHDREGWGVYFGLCTRGDKVSEKTGQLSGAKDNVRECPALWVDIDCAKQGIAGADAISALGFLPFPPTFIVNSGGGLHAYWMLEEPTDVSERYDHIEQACRQLALILAGDTSCAEIARILRLPGSSNSKDATKALNDGAPALVEIIEDTGRVYDLEQLADWLSEQRAVLHGNAKAETRALVQDDPFLAYAKEAGFNPSIDIDDELTAMEHGANGDRSVHQTQLRVSASMIARGYEDDEIVARILTATEAAAPGSERWNWSREEKQIRDMIRTGRSKGYAVKSADKPKPVLALISGGGAALKADNAEPAKAKKEPKAQSSDDITACGEAVIGVWRDRYGPLIHAKGTTYVYSEGIWIEWGDEQAQRLRSLVQEGCQNLRLKPSTSTLNAIFRYVMERPYLRQDSIEFDNHGLLVAADACLDLTTFEVVPHSPDHYATMKSAATLEGDRAHPALDEFLSSAFADRPEAREIISTLQEWFGAAIVPLAVKQRGHKKGLFAHGPSRCSKTQVSELARYLLGREQVCGTRMADFDDRFGVEPLIGMRGWIADDAIGESEYLNSEIYKVVVTGEQTGARRKGGKNWNGRLGIPVLLTANSLPRVRDQSDAVYNRSLILPMTVVRPEDAPEPAGFSCIADKVGMTELTGLLWWAIEGWKRLAARGTFAPPPVMLEANRSLKDDNNPVGAWLAQCTGADHQNKVARLDLVASFNGWRALEHDDAKPWTSNTITRRIEAVMPHLGRTKYNGERMFVGLRLNEDGLFSWRRTKDTAGFEKKMTYSNDETEVNRWHDAANPLPAAPPDRKPRF